VYYLSPDPIRTLTSPQFSLELRSAVFSAAKWILQHSPTLSAFFAGTGLLINACQSSRSDAQSRSAFVAKWLERFADDKEMREIYYEIEYNKFTYNQETFHGSDDEKRIDKLLMHLANAALAQQGGLLRGKDLIPLQYIALRVLNNANIKEYLEFVLTVAGRPGLGVHPYASLIQMKNLLESSGRLGLVMMLLQKIKSSFIGGQSGEKS